MTGNQTLTWAQKIKVGRSAWARLWETTRKGDTYIGQRGMHWLCIGKQTVTDASQSVLVNLHNLPKEPIVPKHGWGTPFNWEHCYTKTVCDEVSEVIEKNPWASEKTLKTLRAAKDLLEDYWTSMHTPYEQRDKANKHAETWKSIATDLRGQLDRLKNRIQHAVETLS